MSNSTKGMMKWPLVIAAALVVIRVVLERLGSPESINNIFGVSWLYFLVAIYFGWVIAEKGVDRPYRVLFRNLLLFGIYTRLMVMPTYWLAYALGWGSPRFGVQMGGVVGENVSPLQGYLLIPVRNALVWIVFAVVAGMIVGGLTLFVRLRSRTKPANRGGSL